jgi:hypothetical protein
VWQILNTILRHFIANEEEVNNLVFASTPTNNLYGLLNPGRFLTEEEKERYNRTGPLPRRHFKIWRGLSGILLYRQLFHPTGLLPPKMSMAIDESYSGMRSVSPVYNADCSGVQEDTKGGREGRSKRSAE